jgi:hypothetical protein
MSKVEMRLEIPELAECLNSANNYVALKGCEAILNNLKTKPELMAAMEKLWQLIDST